MHICELLHLLQQYISIEYWGIVKVTEIYHILLNYRGCVVKGRYLILKEIIYF